MANPIKSTGDELILNNMLSGVSDTFTTSGNSADNAAERFQELSDVYITDEFKARKRLNEDEYKRRRTKNKAAKKARRANR